MKSTLNLPSTIGNEELTQDLNVFKSKYFSPLARVEWEFSDQKDVFRSLFTFLKEESRSDCYLAILQAIKVFTRNKDLLNSVINDEMLDELLIKAGISSDNDTRKDLTDDKVERILEAQRCLSNIYLQCHKSQDLALNNQTLPGVLHQVTKYKEHQVPSPIISFDMKILFLITAQRPESRTFVVVEHRGISRLTDVIDRLKAQENSTSDNELNAFNDVLKAMFNLTIGYEVKVCDEEETVLMNRLSCLIRDLILMEVENGEKKFTLVGNCVNLLTNFQGTWTGSLIDKITTSNEQEMIEYDGKNMNTIQILIQYLEHSISKTDGNKSHGSLKENLSPILKVLVNLSVSHRTVRKYLKQEILPPKRDLSQRPEQGEQLKSKLCRLLTSPNTVASMIAEFLFILCKEKVSRLVKHTGYGNAAGLLARKGLMMGGRGEDNYSDTDSDSDTEDYLANAHKINPVTGHIAPPKRSPFEGMSEEQKEYEANKLANMIHQLHELGAMKPGKIGPDGKPIAVDHVLELIEGEQFRPGQRNEDSDSD